MTVERTGTELARVRRWPRRRTVLFGGAIAAVILLALGAGLVAFRYLPALNEARVLRADLERMVEQALTAGLEIDRATLDGLDAQHSSARERLGRLEGLFGSDPLIAVARALPVLSPNVQGADEVLAAGANLLDAVGDGLEIGRRYVGLRDSRTGTPDDGSALAQLALLMVDSRTDVETASNSVANARRALAAVPDGTVAQIREIRDAMSARIDQFEPVLGLFQEASDRLPAILGWDEPRRYLVLTQDPAEVRPTGGFIGSYGIIVFDRGSIADYSFHDVSQLDFPWDYPRIEPPQELADYLLGATQPWQFADANWSPDFPTSAADALRLYENETGDGSFDGVIGITTYTIDEILKVTGPLEVPDYGVTIASGETTLKTLQLTRTAAPGENRKAFLAAFADVLIPTLASLRSEAWADLFGAAGTLRDGRHILTWFRDPAEQALAARAGIDGAVRSDPGDYIFPVDSNVSPASKLNAWTTRTLDIDVRIDEFGNARNSLEVTWLNEVETAAGATYREMQNVGGRILGMYFRLLVPVRSRVQSVAGGTLTPVTLPATVAEEAGRAVIGAYVKVPAGETSLRYEWTSPYAADVRSDRGSYRLVIQAQPGMIPGPLRLTIQVPAGTRITAASPELSISGTTATLTATFDRDLVVGLRYAP
jgi:hypothetical protein